MSGPVSLRQVSVMGHAYSEDAHHPRPDAPSPAGHARKLLLMFVSSFGVMYAVMYAMADRWAHVYLNLSNVWMTGLMTAAMFVPMLLLMRDMLATPRLKVVTWAAVVTIGVACWFALRFEAGVGDRQFLRAMIPHHSAAIQMVRESDLQDPRVRELGRLIVESQEREIAQMQQLLARRKAPQAKAETTGVQQTK
jgi:hypothetical protein